MCHGDSTKAADSPSLASGKRPGAHSEQPGPQSLPHAALALPGGSGGSSLQLGARTAGCRREETPDSGEDPLVRPPNAKATGHPSRIRDPCGEGWGHTWTCSQSRPWGVLREEELPSKEHSRKENGWLQQGLQARAWSVGNPRNCSGTW